MKLPVPQVPPTAPCPASGHHPAEPSLESEGGKGAALSGMGTSISLAEGKAGTGGEEVEFGDFGLFLKNAEGSLNPAHKSALQKTNPASQSLLPLVPLCF